MSGEPILRVAVPAPLRRSFDYLPPPDSGRGQLAPGMRVVVPLGSRRVIGVILELAEGSTLPRDRLRRALSCPDPAPVVPPDILALCEWAANYYHAPIGETLVHALPAALRAPRVSRANRLRAWQPDSRAFGLPQTALARAPKQADALRLVLRQGTLDDAQRKAAAISLATMRALVDKGLLAETTVEPASAEAPELAPTDVPPALNAEQAAALDALEQGIGTFRCYLLEGVTGSGKTEVYLRLIERALDSGAQALVLVPEIGLTPQARRRFVARFGPQVTVLHSGLGDRERFDAWQECGRGEARVVIGTRSALFSPLPRLGVIIVDEEHDGSFKQQEGFRYSARDLAIYRARQRNVPVVLGSATPSSESLANALSGRYHHLRLARRAGAATAPAMALLDIRGQELDGGLAPALLERIGKTLAEGNQVLVFLNRRGWAPVLSCMDCGWMAECPACDARQTLHRAEGVLWCHHCDTRAPVPNGCPACRSIRLNALGAGTERSEHTLQRRFPDCPIRRIDRGTMQAKGAMDTLLSELERGEPCILVGTQMLAKGHHFPDVTLVAIVDIDGGLFSPDFRAPERTAQLLVQVAGRAGRAEKTGEVLVQTLHPQHPWLQLLVQGGYAAFIKPLLAERRSLGLPPFSNLALIRVESPRQQDAMQLLARLKQRIMRDHPSVELVGPVPAMLQRRAGRFRYQLLLNHAARAPLHAALKQACSELEAHRLPARTRWVVDVDPIGEY